MNIKSGIGRFFNLIGIPILDPEPEVESQKQKWEDGDISSVTDLFLMDYDDLFTSIAKDVDQRGSKCYPENMSFQELRDVIEKNHRILDRQRK